MIRGYSATLTKQVEQADPTLGTKLGKMCIEREVPVSEVAEELDVSRQTVYNWFTGKTVPTGYIAKRVQQFVVALSYRGAQ